MAFWNKIFRKREIKQSRTQVLLGSSGFGSAAWMARDYETFCKETYMLNPIAYKCVFEIASSCASARWELYRKKQNGEKQLIENHPFLNVIKRPNPNESFSFLILKAVSYLVISGNSYFERVSPLTGANKEIPKELYVLRPDRVQIKINDMTGKIKGYKYSVSGQSVFFEVDPITLHSAILHLLSFHPLDDFYGMGATEPLARAIDILNESAEWNKKLMENEARPGMIFKFNGNLSDQQWDRLEKQLDNNYAGSKNAKRTMILEGEGADIKPYGFSPAELDFIESNREKARTIAFAYGVPPMILGIPGDNTYSNQKEARLSFWETTVMWYLNYLRGELNNWIFSNSDFYLDYNLEDIPAIAVKRDMIWERAEKADFITINEKRNMVGMGAVDGGDVILVPANMIPLGFSEENPPNEEPTDDEKSKINNFIKEGYSIEEAYNFIGLPYNGQID